MAQEVMDCSGSGDGVECRFQWFLFPFAAYGASNRAAIFDMGAKTPCNAVPPWPNCREDPGFTNFSPWKLRNVRYDLDLPGVCAQRKNAALWKTRKPGVRYNRSWDPDEFCSSIPPILIRIPGKTLRSKRNRRLRCL